MLCELAHECEPTDLGDANDDGDVESERNREVLLAHPNQARVRAYHEYDAARCAARQTVQRRLQIALVAR
jgi:hypothetical protein